MKISLFGFFSLLIVFSASAGTKTRPVKCLYSSSNGTVSESLCAVRNSKAATHAVGGVCIFNNSGWQRGTYFTGRFERAIGSGKQKTKGEFRPSTICDQGVEYASLQEENDVQEPKIVASSLVEIKKNVYTSKVTYDDSVYPERHPLICYKDQHKITGVSIIPTSCAADGEMNACYLTKLTDVVVGGRKLNGYWWSQESSPTSLSDPTNICYGGVVTGPLVAGNKVSKIVEGTNFDLNSNEDIKYCIVHSGSNYKRFSCNQSICSNKLSKGCCRPVVNHNGKLSWGIQIAKLSKVDHDLINTKVTDTINVADVLTLPAGISNQFSRCEKIRVIKTIE